eukprot:TRINITY_DN1686_c0_g1_i1.p1 TRINITY_DN1686_c0_g1~~TRINITY_DN1686_c0_g1_i1.p1  ORF type:complete len:487 (+),score=68.41 TRINITY_DN1686_c0_g1_i1:27-1463(+)
MKMYITLMVPEEGTIHLIKPAGTILEAGELIARLDLPEGAQIAKAKLYTGTFPIAEPEYDKKASLRLSNAQNKLRMLLAGYEVGKTVWTHAVQEVMSALSDPSLPLQQFTTIISSLTGRIPEDLSDAFNDIVKKYSEKASEHRFHWEQPVAFPVLGVQHAIESVQLKLSADQKKLLDTTLAPVIAFVNNYKEGNHTYAVLVITELLEEYYRVAKVFNDGPPVEFIIKYLRKLYKDDLNQVARITRAHFQEPVQHDLLHMLFELIGSKLEPLLDDFFPIFKKIQLLHKPQYSGIALKTRKLILGRELPDPEKRMISLLALLETASAPHCSPEERLLRLGPVIGQAQPVEDVIFLCFFNPKVEAVAMEAYIRRLYQMYQIITLETKPVTLESKKSTDGKKIQFLQGRWTFSRKEAKDEIGDQAVVVKDLGNNLGLRAFSVGDLKLLTKKPRSESPSSTRKEIGRAVQQECRDRSRMPSSA